MFKQIFSQTLQKKIGKYNLKYKFKVTKNFLIIATILLLLAIGTISGKVSMTHQVVVKPPPPRTWQIKSVDTVKYSRDLALQKLNDLTFDATIEAQLKNIKETGATHVAIDTPYDEMFIPILKRWVQAARDNRLKVWFRGNFSSWEGWFDFPNHLAREDHLRLTREFIQKNPSLFQDGDAFSPCPECENGGPDDPWKTGDIEGARKFMISEYLASQEEFAKINIHNITVLFPMNLDFAKLIMDKTTSKQIGNIITIDHYVKSPEQLAGDIKSIHENTGANIVLGEFGAPIPDIHGIMNIQEQADWLEETLNLLSKENSLIGVNYWTSFGGSTSIFLDDGTPKPAAKILDNYYKLQFLPNTN